jgi:hypothetical protein
MASSGGVLHPRVGGLGAARVAAVLGARRWAAFVGGTAMVARTNDVGESSGSSPAEG